MADDPNPNPNPNPDPEKKDAAFWEAEAKKAFKDRDAAKGEMRKLKDSGAVLTDEQLARYKKLEEDAATAEETRARAAGEFDKLRTQLVDKHSTELKDRDTKLSTLSQRFQSTVITAAFGTAVDYFGAHDKAKTILDVELARDVLGKYVHVEDVETDPLGYRIVVKLPNGDPILGKDGKPAPFTEAIGELINALPNKDRILRGSGKTGSGSSGGSGGHGNGDIDTSRLRPSDFQDPKVREAVKREHAQAGGMVMGRAWEKAGK
jgi:hypothetical protein